MKLIDLFKMMSETEVKKCSKCQEWYPEDEIESTELVEGQFCEQCLIDLREMK